MACTAEKACGAMTKNEDIPQWKKDLIARLRNQNKKTEERLLWIDQHAPHHHAHHPHPKTELVYSPTPPENGFGKDRQSPESSDSEDLHYGPGIVNKLRNKYLSLALRESNARPTILRKATSLENLLDEDEEEEYDGGKEDGRLFRRRGGGHDGGSHMNRYRQSGRRQEMKRARSVEAISRTSHDEELSMTSSVTAKINNRQSLHEEMLLAHNLEKENANLDNRAYRKTVSVENGAEDSTNKYNGRVNRPRRIPPMLNEKEKPPVDVVKHAKMIFEKKPETRTKQPPHTGGVASKVDCFNSMIVKTKLASMGPWKQLRPAKPAANGDVAAKVDSFNNIIVKSKSASKAAKPPIKATKPVTTDKPKSNTQSYVRPVAKPVILSEEMTKPKSLDLRGSKGGKKEFGSLPSPIPDVSRVDIKNQVGSDARPNTISSLCETPDLILTSSPIPKIHSPTYRKRSTECFIEEERNRSYSSHSDATNRYISPLHSPTKAFPKPATLNFNKEDLDALGMKMISPISQKNITKNSTTAVYNFLNAQVNQNHLPVSKNGTDQRSPVSEPLKIEVNGFGAMLKPKAGLSAFEIEKNERNVVKSVGGDAADVLAKKKDDVKRVDGGIVEPNGVDTDKIGLDIADSREDRGRRKHQTFGSSVEKTSSIFENHIKNNGTSADTREYHQKNDHTGSELATNSEKPYKTVPKTENLSKTEELDDLLQTVVSDLAKTHEEVSTKTPKDLEKRDKKNNTVGAVKTSASGDGSEEPPVKLALTKKSKPRAEETTTSVFNFTSRKDVPDYIANDTSRSPSRIVLPKPDEPGIKLLPEALLVNFKEIQDVWEEDELIRSLEARPPSPCDITFINDNILIDGKSNLLQHSSKKVKLKISFVDDADIYEYPSETSLLLEDSSLPSPMGGAAQVGHTVPALSGSSLATYTPKTTESFQLGITKTFHEPVADPKPNITDVAEPCSDIILEEVDQPILFSLGGTSDILF